MVRCSNAQVELKPKDKWGENTINHHGFMRQDGNKLRKLK